MKKILCAFMLLLSLGSTLWIEKATAQTVSYTIRNNDDWNAFREEVRKSKGKYAVDARLETDITCNYHYVGTFEETPYRGTFDGNGHTLNIEVTRNDDKPSALFSYVSDVTIRDLHLTGKMSGGMHSAGLIGYVVDGTNIITIDRVWVSTEVNTTTTHAGGIIGHSNSGNVYMNDCLFDGRVATNNTNDSYAGEIIGWCNSRNWYLNRVYDNGSPVAHWMFYCIEFRHNVGWSSWGSGPGCYTITRHGWNNVNHYNKTDQNEVVKLMNANSPNSWTLYDGKAVPIMNDNSNMGDYTEIKEGSSNGYELRPGRYYITRNLTFSNNTIGGSGMSVSSGATVYLHIPKGVTLTATGHDASGQTGAGAGILLPEGSTLVLEGGGTVKAKGGNAANGGNGSRGGNAGWQESGDGNGIWAGDGGAGGYGGGGAGAGIGTSGANGGNGGGTCWRTWGKDWENHDGIEGNKGQPGGSALAMGRLFVDKFSGIKVEAQGGSKGSRGWGGAAGNNSLRYGGNNYAMAGGGGGGGGGFGGKASNIGTGGAAGGGGGSGSCGSTRWSRFGYFRVGSYGGKGGTNADGSSAEAGSNQQTEGTLRSDNGENLSDRGYESGDNRKEGGKGGNRGDESQARPLNYDFLAQFNVVSRFGGAVEKSKTIGFVSNVNSGEMTVTIPSFEAMGMINQDKYLTQWNTEIDGRGDWKKVNSECTIKSKTTNFYAEWKYYKNLFPVGYGTKSQPFEIEAEELLDFADYVNNGSNTRGLYFKQKGDIVIQDILSHRSRGNKWTPIGHTYMFEGDYDGGGNMIRSGQIDNVGSYIGIFGQVSGSIHNLGVENITISTNSETLRCGAIAGMLLGTRAEKPGQPAIPTVGTMKHCYAANNTISAPYAGGLVGEMTDFSRMSYCHGANNTLTGSYSGGIASQILSQAKVDFCFTTGSNLASKGGLNNTSRCQLNASDKMASGEVAWLLNDQTPFGVTWYQNIDKGTKNTYPVLDSNRGRVYYDDTKYSNEAIGSLFALSGKGLPNAPFLITNLSDLEKVQKFCNEGKKITGIHFLQTADIDLDGNAWKPIGNSEDKVFDGYYDGGGHIIRNGKIETDGFVGLFGVVAGTVTRLGLENMTVKSATGSSRVGGIVGRLRGDGVISNCYVKKSTVTANKNESGVSGAIVGDMDDDASVRNSYGYQNTVSGASFGYICGEMLVNTTQLSSCFTDGKSLIGSKAYGTTPDSEPAQTLGNFAGGSVAYRLNNKDNSNPEPVWYQNIDGETNLDDTPVLSDNHSMVFYINRIYTNDGFDLSKLGKGTKEEPYKIATREDLQNLILSIGIMKRSDFYVLQTADINMEDSLIVPIGTCTDGFEGHYDGGGHVIKNINMLNYQGNAMGLFNNIKGVVEHLGIENSMFKASGSANRVGAFAGTMSDNGVLRNCYVKESTIDFNLTSGVVVGALVGEQIDASRIESCYSYKNTVKGQDDGLRHYGHIVGYIGSAAKDSLVFTDGAILCADKQPGAENFVRSEQGVDSLRFRAGEICYLLGGSKKDNTVWGQTIRTDSVPGFNAAGAHQVVYRHANEYQAMYTNSDAVPNSVYISMDPNHDKIGAKSTDLFKADNQYYVPDFPLAPHAVKWNNYYFAGWSTEANGKGKYYPYDGIVAPPTVPINLYALWDIKIPSENPDNKTVNVVELSKLRSDTIHYKVYDYGGYNSPYGYNYNGKLTLKAPEEHFILLTGTIETEAPGSDNKPRDYMVVYDSDGKQKLTNDHAKSVDSYQDIFFSSTNGVKEDIGRLMSSGDEMTIEFITDNENNFEGLDLLVTVLPKAIRALGQGTKDDPFQVESLDDLKTVDTYIRLTGDSKIYIEQIDSIDMAGETFTPLASSVESFEGHYDGGGYVISNMTIDADTTAAIGLFRNVSGVIERLGIEKSTLKARTDTTRVGAFAGLLSGMGELRYCFAKDNSITFNNEKGAAGALVGELADTTQIKSSYGYRNVLKGNNNEQQNDKVVGLTSASATQELVYCADSISDYTLRSGELCYALNGALRDSVIWRQTIGTDSLPVLYANSKRVYFYNEQGGSGYTNETTATALDLKLMDIVNDANVGYKVMKGSLVNAAEVVPEHRHFVFKGWNTQPDGSGDFYPKDTMFVYNKDLSLYAQYDMVVVMSKDDTEKISQEMPKDIPFAKVYDDGDKDGPYTAGARYVTLIAPEGRVLQLKGTMASKTTTDDSAPQDYLAVYDGNYAADLKNSQKLANDSAKTGEGWRHVYYSTKAGELYNIGTLSSSGREMTIFFQTTDQGKDAFKGIDLTVTQVPVDSAVSVLGKGTEEAPYRAKTAADLKNLAAYSNLKSNSKFSILQTDDIDMEGLTVAPLLNDSAGFAGHYDGSGYVIRNMKMDNYKGTSVGLFGSVSGIVERVGMENCTVKAVANDARAGALAGQLIGNGLLRNCYVVESSISYNDVVGVTGALVGEQKGNSRIEKVHGYKNEVIGFTDRGGNKRYGYIVGDMAATATQNLVFTDGTTFCSDNQGGTFTNANKEVTKDRFASGEVCYLLNESRSDSVIWYQNLGTDSVPVLRASHGVVTYNDAKYGNSFYIYTKEDFIAYADQDADMYLAQDIDLGEWNRKIKFSGKFDGGGHTIRYSGNSNCSGLFDVIRQDASVKHLRVEANILTMRDCGGIAHSNYGTISDCHFRGNITRHNVVTTQEGYVGGITTILDGGTIDHCSATGKLTTNSATGAIYPISPVAETVQDYWTWVDPTNSNLYAAQADSAMKAQADYPVYAKGILDITGPYLVLGNDSITARGGHLSSLTLTDGKRFDCPAVVTVDEITYKRNGTNGAYEPWVLPFDYTIDANMIKNGMEFYRFEKDSTSNSNILVKQISADVPYQVAANEPLAFRTTGNSQYNFGMKLIKDGKSQPLTIRMPSGGVGAQIANTKDMARVVVTYDSIAPARITKELMYTWRDSVSDFVLGDSTTRIQPFRYYLQYIDKPTGNYEQWEQTDWARRQAKAAAQKALSRKQTTMRAPLSAMVADGWQPIILDPRGSQTITAQMLEDYEILALNDIYDAEDPADPDRQRMTVAVIYEQMVEGVTLPTAVPLLVKPRRAGVEPLVTEQMGQEIDALLTAAEQEMSEDEVVDAFNEIHYWCSTFSGRYDVWQMPLPEPNSVLNEFGALVFADTGDDQYFYRIGAADGGSMKAMSYCFTACDPRTLENLPLANDRIEIVTVGYVEATGIDMVHDSGFKDQDSEPTYNLNGQRVNDSYRGIVIKNGRKILKR